MHVMVHIDSDLGPIGAWAFTAERRLRHFYPESLDLHISGRARSLMSARPLDCPTNVWMHEVSRMCAASLCERYEVIEVPDTANLIDVVSDYRRAWNANV